MSKVPLAPALDAATATTPSPNDLDPVATPREPPPAFSTVDIDPAAPPASSGDASGRLRRHWQRAQSRVGHAVGRVAPQAVGEHGRIRTASEGSNPPIAAEEKKPNVIWPILRFVCCLILLIGTAAGYALALEHFAGGNSTSDAFPAPPDASASASPTGGGSSQDDGDSDGGSSATGTFIHGCFVMALIIEFFGLWRTFRTLIRLRLYRKPNEWLTPEELSEAEPSPGGASPAGDTDMPTPRLVRALFGAPPRKPPVPTLPTYESALQQSARQAARREAAAIGWNAGRRGREQIGTGDSEDLELWRLRRLGSLPPTYRSSTMRDNKVVLRGEAPARSTWRLSHLSEVFSRRGSTASAHSRSAAEAPEPVSAVSSFFRRLSLIVNAAGPSSPAPSGLTTPEKGSAAPRSPSLPPLPRSPLSPAPRSPLSPSSRGAITPPRSPIMLPRTTHLRQRSNGSVTSAAGGATMMMMTTPRRPLGAVPEREEASRQAGGA